jgi:hypothetical protein
MSVCVTILFSELGGFNTSFFIMSLRSAIFVSGKFKISFFVNN